MTAVRIVRTSARLADLATQYEGPGEGRRGRRAAGRSVEERLGINADSGMWEGEVLIPQDDSLPESLTSPVCGLDGFVQTCVSAIRNR